MMNVFVHYVSGTWTSIVIPRRAHRPKQFFSEGADRIIASPGGADIGGLFITSREEDFNKLTSELLQDIYQQVCFGNKEIENIANLLL